MRWKKAQIANEAAFQDETGKFNLLGFRDALARAGLDEASYVKLIQQDLNARQITDAIRLDCLILLHFQQKLLNGASNAASLIMLPSTLTHLKKQTHLDLSLMHGMRQIKKRIIALTCVLSWRLFFHQKI